MPSHREIDSSFRAAQVKRELTNAVAVVRKSLDASRNPQHPEDVPHTYDDKFCIVELASRAALAVQLNTLSNGFGLSPDKIQALQKVRGNKTVTLRMDCSTTCAFKETKTREEESATRHERQSVFGKTTYKSVTTITEHFWNYCVEWTVRVFVGDGKSSGTHNEVLATRSATHVIMMRAKDPVMPLSDKRAFDPIDAEITWLLDACRTPEGGAVDFSIDRTDATICHTPRRNEQVDSLLRHARQLTNFCSRVKNQVEHSFRDGYRNLLPTGVESPNFSVINDNVFVPVAVMLALEESTVEGAQTDFDGEGAAAASEDSPARMFSAADFAKILGQQQQEMQEKVSKLTAVLPSTGIVTPAEGILVVCAGYSMHVWRQYSQAVQAVEAMLMDQLIAAIGERIGPADFAKYMNYHNRQLYRDEYTPRGFCYAVRRPDHYPEGTLSIEDGSDDQPVPTTCWHREQGHRMKFALSAAVEVEFEGEHFVHSVVFQKFSNSPSPSLRLIARARQFSSFILMAGNLSSGDVFDPKHALIIQNKDELKIPLILETIPAPQEFRDAIESLSPEQQAFCRAYRKMQLAGTLFAVAVVQIKPQLERLLNLPNDALTKEVKLCQDLMSLFIEYQIPSDLLAYAGTESASASSKVDAVRGYVGNIFKMLDQAKEKELEEEKRRYEKAHPGIGMGGQMGGAAFGSARPIMMESIAIAAPMAMAAPTAMAVPMLKRQLRAVAAPGGPPPPPPAAPRSKMEYQQQTVHAPREATRDATVPEEKPQAVDGPATDYTKLPGKLDANFDQFDRWNSLRATRVKLGARWEKRFQRGLLSKPQTESLNKTKQRNERSRAFDLLDALSKSGALSLSGCTLHVMVAATHCFDLDLLNTVVQDNINPIDRVEASNLIMASTVFDLPAVDLVQDQHRARIAAAELPEAAYVSS